MLKRALGSTGILVSPLGLGTVKFGRNQGVKYPVAFELPDDKTLSELLSIAKSLGMNLLDTAPAYGTSEERLGTLLHDQRQDWVIVSKAGEEFVDGKSQFDFSPKAIRRSVERSLKRLCTDYLDVVLIHSNGDDRRIVEEESVFVTLAQLKKEGMLRAFGMSTKTVAGGLLAVEQSDVVMVTLNPEAQDERVVVRFAEEKRKGILIKKAFASGHYSDVHGALEFIFKEPGVSSVIVGTINAAHLRENALTLPSPTAIL